MKSNIYSDPVNAVAAQKQRDNRITACCDIFRGIVRASKVLLYAQVIVYLLLIYSMFMLALSAKTMTQPLVCALFPVGAAAVSIVKRGQKGNLIALGIDVVSIVVFMYFRAFDVISALFTAASFVIHALRAEKLYCVDKIKDLYGYSRFNSFDICNAVLGDDSYADSIISSYENALDDGVMRYERSSHYMPPLFKKLQALSVGAILIGLIAVVVSAAAMGRVHGAVKVDSIKTRTSGAVKGTVTNVYDIQSYGLDSASDSEYWVNLGGEMVCFSVPDSLKEKFEARFRHDHPNSYDNDDDSVKPSAEPIEFIGEICAVDDSEYSKNTLEVTAKTKEGTTLSFNTRYYIKVYSSKFYNALQKTGVAFIIIGAVVWGGTLVMGALENKRY